MAHVDFGEVVSVVSSGRKHLVYTCRSKKLNGMYAFSKSSQNKDTEYYVCIECKKISIINVPRISIKFGRFINDPDNPTSPHYCEIIPIGTSLAKREMYSARDEIRATKRKPKAVFDDTIKKVQSNESYRNELEAVKIDMENFIGGSAMGYESKRRALSSNRNKDIIRNVTVENISICLQV